MSLDKYKARVRTDADQDIGLQAQDKAGQHGPVSYTHLTLPTIYSV